MAYNNLVTLFRYTKALYHCLVKFEKSLPGRAVNVWPMLISSEDKAYDVDAHSSTYMLEFLTFKTTTIVQWVATPNLIS